LKLVLRKCKSRLAAGPDSPSELLIARFTQASNEFWHILPGCQRAASSVLQSGKHPHTLYGNRVPVSTSFAPFSTGALELPRRRLPAAPRLRYASPRSTCGRRQ
jgi:hypothetical protein